jgi:cell division protein FtsZ
MTDISDLSEMKPRITVFGVGGAGGNAVNNMITAGLEGVEFVVANTDAQALTMSKAARTIQMGIQVTQGLGAGSQPEVGRAAAEEVIGEIRDNLSGAHLVFVTAGMGGGTGTGAATVIAKAARELGILTIGVVTKPFHFEGQRRMRLAEAGIVELQKVVDTLLIIPNQNLFRVASEKTTFADAFAMADRVLYAGVACITDLIVKEGLINLDFADVRAVMREKGKAMMGRGEASGEKRVLIAAETAISNPLIEDPSIKRASGLLISITGGRDLTLFEVEEATTRIRAEADQDANIIVGATFDDSLEGIVRVSVVATGIDNTSVTRQPQAGEGGLTNLAERLRHDSRRIADRGQQDSSSWPMPITPSLLGLAQVEPSTTSTVAQGCLRTPRTTRIDELPRPARNEIRAAQPNARDDNPSDKRGKTLMQRLASIGLGRRAEEDKPNGANAASPIPDPVHSSVSTTRENPHSFPHNLIDEDDSPAFLHRRAN